MADDPTINTEEFARSTEAAEELRRQVDLLKQTSDVLNSAAKAHADSLEKFSSGTAKDTSVAKRGARDIEANTKALKDGQAAISKSSEAEENAAERSEESNDRRRNSFSSFASEVASISKFVTSKLFNIDKATKKMAESFGRDMAKMTDAGGAFLLQKGWAEAVDKFDNLTGAVTDIQKPFLEVRESALQMGMGFGQGFDEARSGLDSFHKAIAETSLSTMTLTEDVTKVHKTLSSAFDPKEMTSNLDKLVGANKDFEAALTNTNAALLVAKAKGMEATETAKMLADAHLYLGETAESVPNIFADIADAAQNSGLHYSTVSSKVMESASSLKMWGGTVRSVTPIFKAFSNSLKEGQKGLAPELLESYVSGIKNMSFATRAFIGMSTGGPGTSAIGAGLKQRDLMSKGAEGMGELSKNLIETITQRTGGEMITAEEAMANPELETAYKIQEDLLKQMLSVSEEQAMKMAPALKDIQKNGMKATDDQKKLLNEAIKSGEKVAQETADAQLDATIKLKSTVQSNGQEMIAVAKSILKSIPRGSKLLKKFDEAQRKMAKGDTGAFGAIASVAKGTPLEKPLADLGLAVGRLTKKETVTKEQKDEISKGQKAGMDFVADFTNRLAELKQGAVEGRGQEMGLRVGQINKIGAGEDISAKAKPVQKILGQMFRSIGKEIKELHKKGKKLSREEAAKLLTLRDAKSQVGDMMRAKTINLNQFEKKDGGEDKEENPMERFIRERSAAAQKQFDRKKDMLFGRGDFKVPGPKDMAPEDMVKNAQAQAEKLMHTGRGRVGMLSIPKRDLPINQAQDATREARDTKQSQGAMKPKPIEQEVFFKISATPKNLLIEVDEEKMRKQVPEVLANTE